MRGSVLLMIGNDKLVLI